MIGIVYPHDRWILEKIGKELVKAFAEGRQDITYWINWKYWGHYKLIKSKFDIVLFTHYEGNGIDILNKADLVVAMSKHGRKVLLELGIDKNKIKVCPYFGLSVSCKKKIVIGTSGHCNISRKNFKEVEKLKSDLNPDIFSFRHQEITDDSFFRDIDYYLQTSIIEGGSMDVLNAIYARVPVVSRDIGFIYSFKTGTDFIYNNYRELLFYFKAIEKDISEKDKYSVGFSWDNFREWHKNLFINILNGIIKEKNYD